MDVKSVLAPLLPDFECWNKVFVDSAINSPDASRGSCNFQTFGKSAQGQDGGGGGGNSPCPFSKDRPIRIPLLSEASVKWTMLNLFGTQWQSIYQATTTVSWSLSMDATTVATRQADMT